MVQLPFTPGPVHAGTWVALLLEAALKGTLLLIAVGFAVRFLRRGTAAVRHWILTCATAGVLALPLLSVLLPVWPVPIFPDTALWSYAVAKVGSPDVTGSTIRDASPPATPPVQRNRPAVTADVKPQAWRAVVLLLWAGGTAAVLLRLIVGTGMAWRIARRAMPFTDGRTLRTARTLARQMRIAPARVLRSAEIETPLTLGVFEPVVILPWDADRWPEARLRVALLHELSHVKRHDCFTQLVADVACAFYWFHPVVWHAARRLRLERERACDDCVIRSGVRPSQYAAHLLDLACALSGRTAPRFALHMAQPSQLQERMHAILDPHVRRHAPSRAGFATALLLIGSLVVPLAALDPWAPAHPEPLAAAATPPLTSDTG